MRTIIVLLLFSLFAGPVYSATPRFELNDGTVITGTIIEFSNGVYVVKTASLGTVRVNQQDIRNIVYGDPGQPPAGDSVAGISQAQIEAMQKSMAQDAGLMSLIQALQNDPDMQAILADPEITRAVAAGDFAALINNKKILQLMENPKIKEIVRTAEGG